MTVQPPSEPAARATAESAADSAIAAARANVARELASRTDRSAAEPVTAYSAGLLGPVSAQLSAALARRMRAGLSPTGAGPSRPRLAAVRGPAIALAALDAIGLTIALAQGRAGLAIGAGVLLALFAALALYSIVATARDPLQLTAEQRDELTAASSWRSEPGQLPPPGSPGHRLVELAAAAAERIATSEPWLETRVDLLPLDLRAVLDHVTTTVAASDVPTDAAVTDVATMSAYAAELTGTLDADAHRRIVILGERMSGRTPQP